MSEETIVTTLRDAVALWNAKAAQAPGTKGVIALLDNLTYAESLTGTDRIVVPEQSALAIVAAAWPVTAKPGAPGVEERVVGALTPVDRRAHLLGAISVRGTSARACSQRLERA